MKCYSAKKMALEQKYSFLLFFGVFLGFEHSYSVEPGKLYEKCYEKQLQGSRKLVQGTRSSVRTSSCDKSADSVPENCKKVEIWPKRHLKAQAYTCVEAWKNGVRCFYKRN